MLGVLIPGVREVRAPLLAGAMLLAAVYLLLFGAADSVPAESQVSPGLQSLYEVLGRNGLLTAAAIVAYLVGTVLGRLTRNAMRDFNLSLVPRVAADEFRSSSVRRGWLYICRPFSRPAIHRIVLLCEKQGSRVDPVLNDIVVSGGKRLLAVNRDLYMEYDRLRSEADLRLTVVLPALLLAVVVAMQVPGSLVAEAAAIAVVAVIVVVLLADALTLTRQANSMYAHAVADGIITTPTLDSAGP